MVKTKDDVCRLAARELGMVAVSQAAPGGTFAVIQEKFDNILAELQGKEIAAWGTNETPDECADSLAMLIAQRAAFSAASGPEIRDYLIALGNQPYFNFIASAARKWNGARPSGADKF